MAERLAQWKRHMDFQPGRPMIHLEMGTFEQEIPYLAGTSRRDDRPPTHFFVKKKFIPIGGAETATQKVPSVFCYASPWIPIISRAFLGAEKGVGLSL